MRGRRPRRRAPKLHSPQSALHPPRSAWRRIPGPRLATRRKSGPIQLKGRRLNGTDADDGAAAAVVAEGVDAETNRDTHTDTERTRPRPIESSPRAARWIRNARARAVRAGAEVAGELRVGVERRNRRPQKFCAPS